MTDQAFILPPELEARKRIAGNIHRYLMAALPGVRLRVVVSPVKKKRSQDQNRYLWGVVYPTILQHSELQGWSAEDLHEFFLGEFYGWDVIEGFGAKRKRPIRRSSKMSTTEFSDYVARIQVFMAGLGVYVPDPNEGDQQDA